MSSSACDDNDDHHDRHYLNSDTVVFFSVCHEDWTNKQIGN